MPLAEQLLNTLNNYQLHKWTQIKQYLLCQSYKDNTLLVQIYF